MIKCGDRVEFLDGHVQVVIGVQSELDDQIVWLKQQCSTDPAWVSIDELQYDRDAGRWVCNG